MDTHPPRAGILITVTKFVEAVAEQLYSANDLNFKGSGFCDATVTLKATAGGFVSQDQVDGPIRVDRDRIVDLVFEVAAKPGESETYHPVGISFFGGHRSGVGMLSFPTRTVVADAMNRLRLTVRDDNTQPGAFKFSLMLQRQSDGAIGVIDPLVNNA